jgi:hypothetical protein
MITNNAELMYKAFLIEATTKLLVLKGVTDWEKLVKEIDEQYQPTTEEEMEVFGEAIIYARCAVLN